jgi:putative hydrolase of the HAD superfamily
MRKDISGVGFDLDGTLYPNYRFYVRLMPFILREHRLLRAFGKARTILRREAEAGRERPGVSFYERQAGVMAEILGEEPEKVLKRTEGLIYRGWEPLFKSVRLFPHVRETLRALQSAGLKTGLLSDFPPEGKIEYLGLEGLWDSVLCSELIGRLKPDPQPFLSLADSLGLAPEKILYVGNSVSYDILGAAKMGMRTALRSRLGRRAGRADLVFHDYRQLLKFVLG